MENFRLLFVLLFSLSTFFNHSVIAQNTPSIAQKGIELFKNGDFDEAIKYLQVLVKTNPQDFDVWYYLGLSFLKKSNVKNARRAIEKAVKLNPQSSQAKLALAYILLSEGKLLDANDRAKEVLKTEPNSFEAFYLIGVVNFNYESFNLAYENAVQTIKLNPNYADAYLLKSKSLISSFGKLRGVVTKDENLRTELLNEAITDLEKYIQLSSNSATLGYQKENLESLKYFAEYFDKRKNLPKKVITDEPNSSNITPVNVMDKPRAGYTESARHAGISGTVRLLVVFSEEGKIKGVLVLNGLSNGLTDKAIEAVRGIKFKPATENGKPISVVKEVTYTFALF